MDSDDGFNDCLTEDEADQERELDHLKNSLHKVGLLDGIEKGREKALQAGFDQGLAKGLKAGYASHCVDGAVRTLLELWKVQKNPKHAQLQEIQQSQSSVLDFLDANGYSKTVVELKKL